MGAIGRALGNMLRHHEGPRHLHAAFRFPARLHHRVSRTLIEEYSNVGDLIIDPFVGCGTNQLEAAVLGRSSIGFDVDPLSVFITSAKLGSRDLSQRQLGLYADRLMKRLEPYSRRRNYDKLLFRDITKLNGAVRELEFSSASLELLQNWFRNYVIEDLAIILGEIRRTRAAEGLKRIATLAFASAIRGCSDADPVPVSGLEYTRRMRELDDRGRRINPFEIFERRLRQITAQATEFSASAEHDLEHRTIQHDVTLPWPIQDRADLIIFSPPYLNAVEYSRRHKLEMAWLKLYETHDEFVTLANHYIGHRASGPVAIEDAPFGDAYIDRVRQTLRDLDYTRARAFIKYCLQLKTFFKHAKRRMKRNSRLIVVVGDNTTAGVRLSSDRLMAAVADPLRLVEQHRYSLRNRYMTYSRHNGADIAVERILVFQK